MFLLEFNYFNLPFFGQDYTPYNAGSNFNNNGSNNGGSVVGDYSPYKFFQQDQFNHANQFNQPNQFYAFNSNNPYVTPFNQFNPLSNLPFNSFSYNSYNPYGTSRFTGYNPYAANQAGLYSTRRFSQQAYNRFNQGFQNPVNFNSIRNSMATTSNLNDLVRIITRTTGRYTSRRTQFNNNNNNNNNNNSLINALKNARIQLEDADGMSIFYKYAAHSVAENILTIRFTVIK